MNENLRKILVFGATGNTGIEICKLLDQSGIWHAAFVRSTSQAKITTTNTKILVGDVLMKDDVIKP